MNLIHKIKVFLIMLWCRFQDLVIFNFGKFSNPVVEKIWKRTIRTLKIYTGICVLLLFLVLQMKNILQQHFWQETNPYYYLLHFLDQWRYRIPAILYALGCIAIIFRAFRQSVYYLDYALSAARKIADDQQELIILPSDFKEIETQFNNVKLEVRNNARAAKEAEQRKNDLVVYLAHDLKTPLTSIIGYLSLLSEEREISPELQQKYLGIALSKAERLEDLINEFFEITRFNLTRIVLECSNINLTRLLQQLLYEFSPMLAEKNLTCRLDAKKDIYIYCDGDKMQRVFDNLLRNAVNYSYPGTEIEILLEEAEKKVHLQFLNHGNTIPEEKLNRLFEQFFRLDSSRGSGNGGAGLGLAIAKEIVEQHGGCIRASSMNQKIVFDVELPATSE